MDPVALLSIHQAQGSPIVVDATVRDLVFYSLQIPAFDVLLHMPPATDSSKIALWIDLQDSLDHPSSSLYIVCSSDK